MPVLPSSKSGAGAGGGAVAGAGAGAKNTLQEINRLQRERDERRKAMDAYRSERAAEQQRNAENGNFGDVDFQRLVRSFREERAVASPVLPHVASRDMKICIAVRKRPINVKEIKKKDYDSVTCMNPTVIVHDCKFKVDGITKFLDSNFFEFDHTFHEDDSTDDVYLNCVENLLPFVLKGGRATVFAYGQTGSGKTHTMVGIQSLLASDLFQMLESEQSSLQVFVSFFEIYGGRCQDLLNNRNRLNVREDGSGEVVVSDLAELQTRSVEETLEVIEMGNKNRTTHATESNDESSRSHAICQISLRLRDKVHGKLSLIDLAGSERGSDTKSNNRQRRLEGAEINKSLLALKECIRALDSKDMHVPYRASKLTLVLKDSFTRAQARTVMIATISPAASSADHTINTLRYADRVKERTVGAQAAAAVAQGLQAPVPSNGRAGAVKSSAISSAPQAQSHVRPHQIQQQQLSRQAHVNSPEIEDEGNDDFDEPRAPQREQEDVLDEFNRTVEKVYEEEEELLNLHMNVIQENAELLTEEGRLLQAIQSDGNGDYDIDRYAARLMAILQRKQELNAALRSKLASFREVLTNEERASKMVTEEGYGRK